jgi:hypothetical protein
MSTIRGYKKYCDEHARQPAHILVEMDFEDFPGSWSFGGQATGGNSFEEPHQGRRSARLTLPGNSGRAFHPLPGMNPRAETISFYARSRGKNSSNQLVMLLNDENAGTSLMFSYEFQITSEWRPYSARIMDFKPYNAPAKKEGTITPGRIRNFAFECGQGAGTVLELQVDSLRVEGARK